MTLAQLHIKSGYSFKKSMIQLEQLVHRGKELGYTHLALTDENVMHGVIPFYQLCKQYGITPIIGMEIELDEENMQAIPFILLAKTTEGYKKLMQISSNLNRSIKVTMQEVIDKENIITIIPTDFLMTNGDFSFERFQQVIDVFSEEQVYYGISIVSRAYWNEMKQVLDDTNNIGLALSNVRFLLQQDKLAYSYLRAMMEEVKWDQEALLHMNEMHLESLEEQNINFSEWKELVKNQQQLVESCNVQIDFHKRFLPAFPVPTDETADDYLERICYQQLKHKYPDVTDEIYTRLNYELDVIQSMGFSDYFLIVSDFIQYAKAQDIMVGPGRGSAAGSLVAFILGITNVDPIKYDLLFERFLNPERITMPDIDIDFSDEKRDQVIRYVQDKYGTEHVAQIITFGTFQARSVLRELAKVMAIEESDLNYILKLLPKDSAVKLATMVNQSTELIEYVKQSEKLMRFFKIANRLEGLPRHSSTHAAGVIISKNRLTEHVPIMQAENGIALTQYAMKELEQVGLLKMDFLGLRNLTLLERLVQQLQRQKITIDLDNLPLDDIKTFELLQKGLTNGIFQLESEGMKHVLRNMIPTQFEDIVAVNALYRPGPMQFIETYNQRKNGREDVTYLHQELEEILQPTYGVLIYQEQIMQIANKIAGFSYGEADILRRAVSKKERDAIIVQKKKFIDGCKSNGYSNKMAEEIFEWIVQFSNYGFNKSHAVAYSLIAYQLAYIKANYPNVFFAELLSMQIGNPDKLQVYLKEAKNNQIHVLPPTINKSIGKFRVEGKAIRIGLRVIKGVGYPIIQDILNERKNGSFKNIFDFCMRLPHIKRQVLEQLILAGVFDETYANRRTILATLGDAMEQAELFGGMDPEFNLLGDQLELDVTYHEKEPFPIIKQLLMEQDVIGFFVSEHPLATFRQLLQKRKFLSIYTIKQSNVKKVKLAGVVQSITMIRTKKGESMAFMTIADESDSIDTVMFPNIYRNCNDWLEENMFIQVTGRVEERQNKLQMIIESIQILDLDQLENSNRKVYINWKDNHDMRKLEEIARRFPGMNEIYIYKKTQQKLFKLGEKYQLELTEQAINELNQLFGENDVAIREGE